MELSGLVRGWTDAPPAPDSRSVGSRTINRVEYQGVNVRDLSRVEPGEVTPEVLKAHGLIGTLKKPVKILGTGEIEGAYQVSAHAFSGCGPGEDRRGRRHRDGSWRISWRRGARGRGPETVAAAAPEVTESEEAPSPDGDRGVGG